MKSDDSINLSVDPETNYGGYTICFKNDVKMEKMKFQHSKCGRRKDCVNFFARDHLTNQSYFNYSKFFFVKSIKS